MKVCLSLDWNQLTNTIRPEAPGVYCHARDRCVVSYKHIPIMVLDCSVTMIVGLHGRCGKVEGKGGWDMHFSLMSAAQGHVLRTQ
jgi:hypothetical protein